MTFCEKTYKFAAILVHPSHQSSLSFEWIVTYIKDFRLGSSRLFYLCEFNLAAHRKCWKKAFCIVYEAKFAEVKQANEVEPQGTLS